MSKNQNIAVIGSGYVGTTTAAILANCGYNVTAIDVDSQKVDQINKGLSPFFEQGLDSLLSAAVKMKTLEATNSYEKLAGADIVLSCVGTPDNPDGSSNLSYVFSAAAEAAKHMPKNSVYVQKSTVPVGTGARIEELFKNSGKIIHYVSNPEFLRESTAIADTLYFDRIVAGGIDKKAVEKILDIYRSVEKHRREIAKQVNVSPSLDHRGDYITTNRDSAELIKVTSNAFLALKVSFANSIAKLADHTNADINEIMDAVGADKRIGRAFLNAGRGYGGGCLVKDVSGLISSADEYGVELSIMTAATDVNESMSGYIANKAQKVLGKLNGRCIAVLGLAFKAGTSDTRRSPGVQLANILAKDGATVSVYDPKANGEAKEDLRKNIIIKDSVETAIKDVDAVFVATDWPQFLQYNLKKLAKHMRGNLFVDCMNAFNSEQVKKAGLEYIGVGKR